MKIDTSLSGSIATAATEAADAEQRGYDGIWSAELNHDPFLPLVSAATGTQSISLGTSIAVAFARSPMTVAQVAWDLQHVSNGRLIAGLGSQIKPHIEKRFSMPWSHPASRMREFVLAMRAIWDTWQTGVKLDFRGEFYSHTLMTPMFDPGPLSCGPPHVYLAAVGPAMTEVAAEVADGVMLHAFTTDRYVHEVTLPAVERGLRKAGRSRSDFTVKFSPFVASGGNDAELAEALEALRRRIAFYASTPAYRPVLEMHGWGDRQTELNRLSKRGEWERMGELVDDDMLDAFAVVAPPRSLIEAVVKRVAGTADRTSMVVTAAIPPEALRGAVAKMKSLASQHADVAMTHGA